MTGFETEESEMGEIEKGLQAAVSELVVSGALVAIGGQNALRNPVATSLEIARQEVRDISLVGCNLSIAADILVGAGLVSKISCGTINFEVFGVPEATRLAIESGRIAVADHDHSTIIARLFAARLNSPFIALSDLGQTDWLLSLVEKFPDEFSVLSHAPFVGREVVLARSLRPDVCLLHVQATDTNGNLYVRGPECFDQDLAFASKSILATCEKILPPDDCIREFGKPMIPGAYVAAAIPIPNGARPTAVPGFYEADGLLLNDYNAKGVLKLER